MLAIMYGGRSGEIGALLPHVAALFPQAMEFTERAARIGEAGGQVTTFLGRTSPPVSDRFREIVADRSSPAAESRAVSTARAHGRMTRNFIVQGTAAEWALCWMGSVRTRLLTETIFCTMSCYCAVRSWRPSAWLASCASVRRRRRVCFSAGSRWIFPSRCTTCTITPKVNNPRRAVRAAAGWGRVRFHRLAPPAGRHAIRPVDLGLVPGCRT